MNAAETQFAKKLDNEGKLWFFEPKSFPLPEPNGKYLPDFFVVEDNKFYEVVGSRQAFSYNRSKYECFRATYPHLSLEIVNMGAWKNGKRTNRVKQTKRSYSPLQVGELSKPLCKIKEQYNNRLSYAVLSAVQSGKYKSMYGICRNLGLHINALSLAFRGKGKRSDEWVDAMCRRIYDSIEMTEVTL